MAECKCIVSVVSPFEVYDSGKEIGVLFKESAHGYHHYPIAYQGSIEDTYTLARLTCEVLKSFYNSGIKFPECLEQFTEEESGFAKNREEYLTNLRLFLQYGGCETCGQCRFLQNETCKTTIVPGAKVGPNDHPCCIGIRKEQE